MKKALTVLAFLGAVVVLFLTLAQKPHPRIVLTGNTERTAVSIAPGSFQCSTCKMPIESETYAAEAVAPGGKTWFFDDIGCLALWLDGQPFADRAAIWVHTLDTHTWIDGRKAWYDPLQSTPMGYGFGAVSVPAPGRVDFETMMRRMREGKHLLNRDYARRLAASSGVRDGSD